MQNQALSSRIQFLELSSAKLNTPIDGDESFLSFYNTVSNASDHRSFFDSAVRKKLTQFLLRSGSGVSLPEPIEYKIPEDNALFWINALLKGEPENIEIPKEIFSNLLIDPEWKALFLEAFEHGCREKDVHLIALLYESLHFELDLLRRLFKLTQQLNLPDLSKRVANHIVQVVSTESDGRVSYLEWFSQEGFQQTALSFARELVFADNLSLAENRQLSRFLLQEEAWELLITHCCLLFQLSKNELSPKDHCYFASLLALSYLKENQPAQTSSLLLKEWHDPSEPFPFIIEVLENIHLIPSSPEIIERLCHNFPPSFLDVLEQENWKYGMVRALRLEGQNRLLEAGDVWNELLETGPQNLSILRFNTYNRIRQNTGIQDLIERFHVCNDKNAPFYLQLFLLLSNPEDCEGVIRFTIENKLHLRDTDPLFLEIREFFFDALLQTGKPEDKDQYEQLKEEGALSHFSQKDRLYFEYLGRLREALRSGNSQRFITSFEQLLSLDLDPYQILRLHELFRKAESELFVLDHNGEYPYRVKQLKLVFKWLLFRKAEKRNVNLDGIDFGNVAKYINPGFRHKLSIT